MLPADARHSFHRDLIFRSSPAQMIGNSALTYKLAEWVER